jgi:PIN domain nuclease of toxin-antitoxin system
VILLDTNGVLWLHHGHRRGRRLAVPAGRLYASPASLLEIQFLVEAGRVRLRPGFAAGDVLVDDRWLLDEPPSVGWFERALEVSWTRDPFDRLLIAHARLRGWRLATGDVEILNRLGPEGSVEL